MKKIIITMLLAITGVVALNLPNAFASFDRDHAKANKKAMMAIVKEFPHAQKIAWQQAGKRIIGKFNSENRTVSAVFNRKGKLICTYVSCAPQYIPFKVQNTLDQKYPFYVSTSMTEYIGRDAHCYFVLLKNQTGNQIKWIRVMLDDQANVSEIQKLDQIIDDNKNIQL